MGVRGLIRDLLGIYLGYEVIRSYFYGNSSLNLNILVASIAIFALAVWFLLERVGVLPKMSG